MTVWVASGMLACCGAAALLWLRGRPVPPTRFRSDDPGEMLVLAAVFWFGSGLLRMQTSPRTPGGTVAIAQPWALLAEAALALMALLCVARRGAPGSGWGWARGAALWAIALPLVRGLEALLPRMLGIDPESPPKQAALQHFVAAPALARLGLAFSLGVAVPVVEECIFRAWLLRAARTGLLRWLPASRAAAVSIVASAAVFAAVHDQRFVVPVFLIGLVLGGILVAANSLGACIAFHALHNLSTLLLASLP